MELRTFGPTGMKVSTLCLGTMVLGAWGNTNRDECIRVVHDALDAGINIIDTADMYADGESEDIVGAALRGRRDDVVVCTKFWNPMGQGPNQRGASRRWIVQAVDASLRRLQTDWIDVYQVHRPDPDVAMDELVATLDDLVRQGKIRHAGTSTWPAEMIVEGQWAAARRHAHPFVSEQPPYSVLARGAERAVLPTCRRYGLGVLVWAPLNGGWLTGKYVRGAAPPPGSRGDYAAEHMTSSEAKHDAVEALRVVAANAGLSLTQLALAWTLEHPAVTAAIIGPKTPAQLAELVACGSPRLDADVLDRIDKVVAPGADVAAADAGWTTWDLDPTRRRRP